MGDSSGYPEHYPTKYHLMQTDVLAFGAMT